MTEITIIHESEPAGLLRVYPGQQEPQGTYIQLDCRTGHLMADYNPEIGNAISFDKHLGHIRTYNIPLWHARTVNVVLDEIAPLAARIVAGYSSEWDENNSVAVLDEDASAAEVEIERIITSYGDEGDLYWVEAGDWLYPVHSEVLALLDNGASVDDVIAEYDGDGAAEDRPVVIGIRNYLEHLAESR